MDTNWPTPPPWSPSPPSSEDSPIDHLLTGLHSLHPVDPYINEVIASTIAEHLLDPLPGPLVAFVFAGQAMTGKTLVATRLAELLGGSKDALFVLTVGQYDPPARSVLPRKIHYSTTKKTPGHLASSDKAGFFAFIDELNQADTHDTASDHCDPGEDEEDPLILHLMMHPSGVILVRHLERADENFLAFLKSMLQTGTLRVATTGQKLSLDQTVVIIETRHGTGMLAKQSSRGRSRVITSEDMEQELDRHIQARFGKQLVNRVDRVIAFRRRFMLS